MRMTTLLLILLGLTACNEKSDPDQAGPSEVIDLGDPGPFDCVWPAAAGEPAEPYPYPEAADRTCAWYRGSQWLSVDGMHFCRIGSEEFECSVY